MVAGSDRFPLLFSNQKAAEGGDLVRCQHLTFTRQAYIHLVPSSELQAGSVSSIVGVLGAWYFVITRLDNRRAVLDQKQPRLFLFCSLIEEGEAVIACNRGRENACGERRAIRRFSDNLEEIKSFYWLKLVLEPLLSLSVVHGVNSVFDAQMSFSFNDESFKKTQKQKHY